MQLLSQPNNGVATARNLALARATGEFVAPVDADDLWAPTKIEKQVAAMQAGGDRIGLVYCWWVVIDPNDREIYRVQQPDFAGPSLRVMCRGNVVGSGSAPLMRRHAVLEAGGYDASLRERGAQGCEDMKLYLAIAEQYEFVQVKECLLGYRWTPVNMSSDGLRMLRSYDLVMAPIGERHPQYRPELRTGRLYFINWLAGRATRDGHLRQFRNLFVELYDASPRQAMGSSLRFAGSLVKNWIRRRRAPKETPVFPGDSPHP